MKPNFISDHNLKADLNAWRFLIDVITYLLFFPKVHSLLKFFFQTPYNRPNLKH